METRPVFEVTAGEELFTRRDVRFKWYGGRALELLRKNFPAARLQN